MRLPFPAQPVSHADRRADLARLALVPDLRAMSVIEGLRAAVACAAVLLAHAWSGWPPLLVMALATMLTCFCDTGGPIRPRVRALITFTVVGALTWSGLGLLQPAGLFVTVPVACLAIFALSLARIWGVPAQAVGNVLVVFVCIALDEPLDLAHAGIVASMVLAGGTWATLFTLVVWRLHPYRPARVAVAEAWRRLALLAGDLRELARHPAIEARHWDAHARVHRRAAREAIEAARAILVDMVRSRERVSARAAQALLRLEAGEQLLNALIALSDELERRPRAQDRAAAEPWLRRLRPLLLVLSRAMVNDRLMDPARIERALLAMQDAIGDDPAMQGLFARIADRARIAAKLSAPDGYRPGRTLVDASAEPWRERVLAPLRANLSWSSANLRHATRAAVVAAPALAVTTQFGGTFAHWLTITLVLTMQPFYAATWQRALERVGGTVLGGIVGALIAYYAGSTLVVAALVFPLCIVGFGARQVSYGAFIACLTPLIVVLVGLIGPGHSSWEIAAMRVVFTVLGGATAVACCLVLWPSWEPDRLEAELARTLAAHAAYADAVFGLRLGRSSEDAADHAVRAAGMATNNLEASLSRALQEPRRAGQPEGRARLDAVMVADATLRRIAGRLSAMRHESGRGEAGRNASGRDGVAPRAEPATLEPWRVWVAASLGALAQGAPVAPQPGSPPNATVARIARQIELLEGTLARGRTPAIA